jgi:hypothetical protein
VEIAMRLNPEILEDADQLTHPPRLHDTNLFGDIPGWIWTAFLSAWGMLFGLFLLCFATDGRATLMVVTACFFAMMTLGLPTALAGHSNKGSKPWPRVIVTNTGPLPTSAAATQILLIPVGAVIGLVAFILLNL